MAFIVDCKSSSLFWNRTDITMIYFDDIKKYQLLSEDEEKRLFHIIKTGTEEEKKKARDKIIESNQRFVVSVARRWSSPSNLLDLINEANIGLINAIETYDETKANHFITWAVWHIRKELNAYVVKKENQVSSKNAHVVYTTVNRIKNEFYAREGRVPTVDEIKEILKEKFNYNLAYEEDLYDITFASINEAYSSDDESYCTKEDNSDYSKISSSCNIEDDIDNQFEKDSLENLLSILNEKERVILKKSYGIDEVRPYKADEIAKELGISGERVRQIRFKALKKLKDNADILRRAV